MLCVTWAAPNNCSTSSNSDYMIPLQCVASYHVQIHESTDRLSTLTMQIGEQPLHYSFQPAFHQENRHWPAYQLHCLTQHTRVSPKQTKTPKPLLIGPRGPQRECWGDLWPYFIYTLDGSTLGATWAQMINPIWHR
jgi:hypothetical protein